MSLEPELEDLHNQIVARNPAEPEFHQATIEVLTAIQPVLRRDPGLRDARLLERLCEPERQTMFRVVWTDDNGEAQVNRGYRVGFSSALGPYKGGLRFHRSVNLGVIKFLAFEQTFKNALTGLGLGAGKGGSDFDPAGRSEGEIMRFCQAFMTELYRHIGPHTDVPAGDIGVGSREIGYLFGQYKRITNRFDAGTLTGKDPLVGGSSMRPEATGYGAAYFLDAMLAARQETAEGKTAVVSGSGNVAYHVMDKLQDLGANVVACSDSTGYLHDPDGIRLDVLSRIKVRRRLPLSTYTDFVASAKFVAGERPWDIPCDLAVPAATQNELDETAAISLAKNGVTVVVEGANMPCTPAALEIFDLAEIQVAPGKAANAGGVATSAFEMQQNAARDRWSSQEIDTRLRQIMQNIHDSCLAAADSFDMPGDYIAGANISGFMTVAAAMNTLGLI